VASVQLRREKP